MHLSAITVTNISKSFTYKTHTHARTRAFNGPLSGTTRVSRYQKGKTNLDFTKARDSEWQWHQQVCTSLQTDNHASTPPLSFYRAMLRIRGTSHGPVSVRLSVRPSHVGVLLKRLNVGSDKHYHTIAQDSSFLTPKISAKFDRGHPLRGRRMQVGWVKIGDF